MKRLFLAPLAFAAALGGPRLAAAESGPGSAPAGGARLGIEDVARLAVESGPELKAARERTESAVQQSKSAGGRLLPSVHVSDEYQHWNSAFIIPQFVGVVPRAQDTNTFAVAGRQPLLGLLHGSHEYSAATRGAEAAAAGVRVDESATREGVELEYLRLFEAKARVDIARASEQELAQEVSETQARVKAGTLTNADLLRVQVAQANARQQGIVAESDAVVSRATLLSAIGRDPEDTTTEFLPPIALLAQPDAPVPRAAEAVARRPEMAAAKLRADAADESERSRFYALLPEVDLEGGYTHLDGQLFAPKNAAFVGVKADWAIWEWGSSYSAREAAAAEARAAALDVDATRRRVLTEVTSRKAELGAAASAIDLAQQTIVSAQEAYRVTEAQVRAGAGTTTDLLNAESALSEARLRLETARYDHAAARIRLERATGAR